MRGEVGNLMAGLGGGRLGQPPHEDPCNGDEDEKAQQPVGATAPPIPPPPPMANWSGAVGSRTHPTGGLFRWLWAGGGGVGWLVTATGVTSTGDPPGPGTG